MIFYCDKCRYSVEVEDRHAGKSVPCPQCRHTVVVGKNPAAAANGSGRAVFLCRACGFQKMVPPAFAGKKAPCPRCNSGKTLVRGVERPGGGRPFFARFGLALAAVVVCALVGGGGYLFWANGGRGLPKFFSAGSAPVEFSTETQPLEKGVASEAAGAAGTAPRFAGKDFHGANLAGKNLRGLNFQNANFEGANLREADLRGVNFSQANLLN
ncbi:MAG: pentapeptide repeat-containing protein, partial [Desulfurivibrionaceae bacterium]